jgi:GTPase SAR1 family protein
LLIAGKTTLLHRLRDKHFVAQPGMTDGIVMSELTVGDIEYTALDFAGQEEYAHTHGLFFDNRAIFLAVHNPRSGGSLGQLEMVRDACVKCIF